MYMYMQGSNIDKLGKLSNDYIIGSIFSELINQCCIQQLVDFARIFSGPRYNVNSARLERIHALRFS